jgi:hypothetical protein
MVGRETMGDRFSACLYPQSIWICDRLASKKVKVKSKNWDLVTYCIVIAIMLIALSQNPVINYGLKAKTR